MWYCIYFCPCLMALYNVLNIYSCMGWIIKVISFDYSVRRSNISDQICLETMTHFEISDCLILYIVNPLEKIVNNILDVVSLNVMVDDKNNKKGVTEEIITLKLF